MAKANSSTIETTGMATKSKKPVQTPKSTGKQTTLLGFFTRTPTGQTPRVEARSSLPLTPLPSSEAGDDVSPVRITAKPKENATVGLRTPETPVAEKNSEKMDIDSPVEIDGSRRVYSKSKAILIWRNVA